MQRYAMDLKVQNERVNGEWGVVSGGLQTICL